MRTQRRHPGARRRSRAARPAVAIAALVAAMAMAAMPSCALLASEPPKPRVGPNKVLVEDLNNALIDVGDELIVRVAGVCHRIVEETDDPRARQAALSFRSAVAIATVINNSQINPLASLLDTMLMVRLSARVVEERGPATMGDRFAGELLRAFEKTEEAIRSIAAQALTEDQVAEFYTITEGLDLSGETLATVTFVRVSEFDLDSDFSRITSGRGGGPRSVFQLLYLDPLAGLDESARQLEQTRMLAERGMYQLQRFVPIIRWQAELAWNEVASSRDVQRMLASVESAAESTRRFADIADRLKADFQEERTAAVADLEAAVARQREAFFDDAAHALDRERHELVALADDLERRLAESMRETRQTVEASERLTESARALVEATDRLVGRFETGSGEVREPSDRSDPGAYADAAVEIAAAAERLTVGIEALQRLIDDATSGALADTATRASDAAAAASRGVLDAFFWRAVVLIALAAVALLAVLIIAGRVNRAAAPRATAA